MTFKKSILIYFFLCLTAMAQTEQPSKSSMVFKSLLLPGWANYELGNKQAAYTHFVSEIALWTGYLYYSNQQEQLVNDYQSFAVKELSLPDQTYSDAFYRLISQYNSYDEYIEFQRRQGNSILGDLPAKKRWQWASEKDRFIFNNRRIEADELEKDLNYWVYGMVLNRVVALFTSRRDYNSRVQINTQAKFSPQSGNQLVAYLHFSF
jgi:hypothetical protein